MADYCVFYAFDEAALDALTSGTATAPVRNRLVNDDGCRYIFSNSGGGSAAIVSAVHAKGASFKYAVAFDEPTPVDRFKAMTAAQINEAAAETRNRIAAIGADYWAYNEVHSPISTDPAYRAQQRRMFRALHQPTVAGTTYAPMRGVVFSIGSNVRDPGKWTGDGIREYWEAVDDTALLWILEQYKSARWVSDASEAYIGSSMFELRRWLDAQNNAKLQSVAHNRFTVMLSPYYGRPKRVETPTVGDCEWHMNWAGADPQDDAATPVVRGHYLERQRDFFAMLEKQVHAVRTTPGGYSRIAFAPLRLEGAGMGLTPARLAAVAPRLAMLFNWHYRNGANETKYLDNYEGNARFAFTEHPSPAC